MTYSRKVCVKLVCLSLVAGIIFGALSATGIYGHLLLSKCGTVLPAEKILQDAAVCYPVNQSRQIAEYYELGHMQIDVDPKNVYHETVTVLCPDGIATIDYEWNSRACTWERTNWIWTSVD